MSDHMCMAFLAGPSKVLKLDSSIYNMIINLQQSQKTLVFERKV